MKEIETFDKSFWIVLIAFVIVIAIICFFPIWLTGHGKHDFTDTGEIGDTIGGIMGPFVAICVGILTFFAFWVQFKANEQQKQFLKKQSNEFKFERLETRLFELIKWHRDNVSEISYTTNVFRKNEVGVFIPTEIIYTSRKVFKIIFDEFIKLYNEALPFIPSKIDDIYTDQYLKSLSENKLITSRVIDLHLRARIDVVYTLLHYGLSEEGINVIKNAFSNRYKSDFTNILIYAIKIKPAISSTYWDDWQQFIKAPIEQRKHIISDWILTDQKGFDSPREVSDSLTTYFRYLFKEKFTKYYGGHQFRLAHYFTHLFHIVAYIHNSKILKLNSKVEYVKILRAQLSTYEQIIFFINTISYLGRAWEFEINENPSIPVEGQLVTTYKLIKNIPNDLIFDDIMISKFYPNWHEYS